jgi:pseudaminic acid cytidylyltransferase
MVLWVLEQIKASGQFDVIHVSTDDEEIFEVASSAGFRPEFMRSPVAATDSAPLSDVKKDVLDRYRERGSIFDTVAIFFATAVFLDAKTITKALKQFESNEQINEMISVAKFQVPIEWAFTMGADGVLTAINDIGIATRSQDLPVSWHETGEFVFYKKGALDTLKNSAAIKGGYPIEYLSIDLDTPEDWDRAEQLFYLKKRLPL